MVRQLKGIHVVFEHLNTNSELIKKSSLDYGKDHTELRIFRGFGQQVSDSTKLHVNVVYRIMTTLQMLGCIRKLRHGGPGSPSLYEIVSPPVDHEIELMRERSLMSTSLRLPNKSDRTLDSVNKLHARVDALERRIKELEKHGGFNIR